MLVRDGIAMSRSRAEDSKMEKPHSSSATARLDYVSKAQSILEFGALKTVDVDRSVSKLLKLEMKLCNFRVYADHPVLNRSVSIKRIPLTCSFWLLFVSLMKEMLTLELGSPRRRSLACSNNVADRYQRRKLEKKESARKEELIVEK